MNQNFKPATLHITWIVLKLLKEGCEEIAELKKRLHVNAETELEFDNALKLGGELDWIGLNHNTIELKTEGSAAIDMKHWRLFRPTPEQKLVLERHDLTQCLLDNKTFEARPKVLDLFAGVGGLALGFESAGFDVVASIDNDPQACEAHKKNFPNAAVIQADINEFSKDPTKFLTRYGVKGNIDGVIGGPPCQGFSHIGERVVDDDRNFLTTRFTDVVLKLKPKFFLMENVAGLKTIGGRGTLNDYLVTLCKPIGRPASEITSLLPDVQKAVAKRSPQFKKRAVSRAVSRFKSRKIGNNNGAYSVEACLKFINESPSQFSEAFFNACTEESAALTSAHAWVSDAKEAILNSRSHILRIALGTFCEQKNDFVQTNWDEFIAELQSQASSKEIKTMLGEVLSSFYEQPTEQAFGNEKIGPILHRIIDRLQKDYKIFGPKVLNAYKFGAPQSRQRLFLIGVRKDIRNTFEFPTEDFSLPGKKQATFETPAPTCEEALADLPDVDTFDHLISSDVLTSDNIAPPVSELGKSLRLYSINEEDWTLPRDGWNPLIVDCCTRTIHTEEVIARLEKTAQGIQEKTSGKTRLRRNGVSHTLRAGTREAKGSHTAVRPVHYEFNRVVTVREGARLMGFPDWMTFHPTKWHGFRLVGNAVPFHLGRALAKKLKKAIS